MGYTEIRPVWLSTMNLRQSSVKGRAENSGEARPQVLCTTFKIIPKVSQFVNSLLANIASFSLVGGDLTIKIFLQLSYVLFNLDTFLYFYPATQVVGATAE